MGLLNTRLRQGKRTLPFPQAQPTGDAVWDGEDLGWGTVAYAIDQLALRHIFLSVTPVAVSHQCGGGENGEVNERGSSRTKNRYAWNRLLTLLSPMRDGCRSCG